MKTQLLLLFSFLFTLFSNGFSYGESSAEFVISPETLNLIKQNLRPFENVSFEFMTELEDQKTKKWELEGRHRIIIDFSKGFYKLSSVKRFLDSKHQRLIAKRCYFIEKGWDGKNMITVEKRMKFTPTLQFSGIRNDKYVLATVSSGKHQDLFAHLCEFLELYEGRRFDESLYFLINTPNMRGFTFSQKSKNEIMLSDGRGLELTFNKENGAILNRIRKVRAIGNEIFEMENFKVEKTENKNGWLFPVQVVFTYREQRDKDKIVLRRRTTLVPDTLSINDKITSGTFTPKIPVRAHLVNNINNTERIVTELDPLLDREGFQKQMDTFVDELRKDLKK